MSKFTLFHPDTEVLGQMMLDFEQAINSDLFLPIMQAHGLDNLQAEAWYPGQKWLSVLEDLSEQGSMLDLVSIGMRQIAHVEWPPEFDNMCLLEVLQALNPVYQSYYRGTDVGEIQVREISPKHYQITLRVFEPDDLWYGNLYAIVRKFAPSGQRFTLKYDSDTLRHDLGGDHTVLNLLLD